MLVLTSQVWFVMFTLNMASKPTDRCVGLLAVRTLELWWFLCASPRSRRIVSVSGTIIAVRTPTTLNFNFIFSPFIPKVSCWQFIPAEEVF